MADKTPKVGKNQRKSADILTSVREGKMFTTIKFKKRKVAAHPTFNFAPFWGSVLSFPKIVRDRPKFPTDFKILTTLGIFRPHPPTLQS